jgi:hypothetical protein
MDEKMLIHCLGQAIVLDQDDVKHTHTVMIGKGGLGIRTAFAAVSSKKRLAIGFWRLALIT